MSSEHTDQNTCSSLAYNEIERRRAVKVGWVNSLAAARHGTHSNTSWGKSRKHYTTSLRAKEKTHQRYHHTATLSMCLRIHIVHSPHTNKPTRRVWCAPPAERPRQKTRGQAESQPKYPWTQPFCCCFFRLCKLPCAFWMYECVVGSAGPPAWST